MRATTLDARTARGSEAPRPAPLMTAYEKVIGEHARIGSILGGI